MHSAGLELTKLTYTRLEDNLIRHRGDRHRVYVDPACPLRVRFGGDSHPESFIFSGRGPLDRGRLIWLASLA